MTGRTARIVALGSAVVAALALGPHANADPDDPVIPSRDEIVTAQQRVEDTERSVADIQAELLSAQDQLEQLAVEAAIAAERYNGAVLGWQQAQGAAMAAQRRSERAAVRVDETRSILAGYVLAEDTTTTDLTTFSTALEDDGADRLLDHFSQFATSSDALDARYQAWQAASQLAEVYQRDAAQALHEAQGAKREADAARAAAQQAVDSQTQAVVSIGVQRDQLLQELAAAQNVSVQLATQRQEALEQRRADRLAEARRLELLRQERAERREQERLEAQQALEERQDRRQARAEQEQAEQQRAEQQRAEQARAEQQPARGGSGGDRPSRGHSADNRPPRNPPRNDPQPQPEPEPQPQPQPAPQQSGSARSAIAFASAQLGEPYVWGAAGPDSWDCSGLTMAAWAAAGVYLPHYSVSQYYATTPVSYSGIRPGDLVFWATNPSDPGTIFHVGLYIGNGQMIHAPRTGKDVEVQDVWYWESPDFFGRP